VWLSSSHLDFKIRDPSLTRQTVRGSITNGTFSPCTTGGLGSNFGWSISYPHSPRGLSAWTPQTVLLVVSRLHKSLACKVVLPLWIGLGLVPRVGMFVMTT
jgi:hypothetical protein